ncbi:MAG: zf-TFIIB domain-containing protein [Candidatus Binatia bacterium]
MECPNCRQPMDSQSFDGKYGKVVLLDLCFPCSGLWFDSHENLQLTAGAILRLFTILHEKHVAQLHTLRETLRCPRCTSMLRETLDMQRSTRFHYFRCLQEHGRFITFFQFLREKNFVRSLNAKEVSELTQYIKTLNCSNCGAAVDLEKTSACTYCRTPIAMLDPRQLETTLRELRQTEEKRQAGDPLLPTKFILDKLKTESEWKRQSGNIYTADYSSFDLIQEGLTAVIDLWGESK